MRMFSGSSRRILIDSNVLIAALRTPDGVSAQALRIVLQNHNLILSPQILNETSRNLHRLKMDSRLIDAYIAFLKRQAHITEPTKIKKICRDPDDDAILAAGQSGKVDLIITGDKDLLDCPFPVRIISPRDFMEEYS